MDAFGRYELVRPLDRGGMGEVWLARARGPERVHKTVVLKRIRAEREADEAARQRFAEEARVAIALSHPHIVPVFEFGELDGNYFLVMEWLRGGNLGRVAGADREPLSWAATALIGTQLCDALAYVHGRANKSGARLVHGDLTPRNILFSTDGHALLADFGLARFAGRGRAGTVRYQAPEQARGEPFDERADLYALALVLSEAATGRPAYDRDPERAAKQARVGVIPDFGGVDEELARVLRRALAATPDGRFADAAAMRAAFEALLDREPGARAAARAQLIARVAAATVAGEAAGEGTRTAGTQGTREATVARLPRRRGVVAAVALGMVVAAGAWVAGRGGEEKKQATGGRRLATGDGERRQPATGDGRLATGDEEQSEQATGNRQQATGNERSATAARGGVTSVGAAKAKPRVVKREAAAAVVEAAELDVNATPWAHVRVDGVARGETPLLGLSLAPGTHKVELANEPLGVHRELTVTLRPGEHARRVEDLSK